MFSFSAALYQHSGVISANVMTLVTAHWLFYCAATAILLVIAGKATSTSSVYDLASLTRKNTFYCIAAICSMAGVPPFIGFWTKAAILLFIGANGAALFIAAAWLAALCGILFYVTTLRHSVSLKTANSLIEESAESGEASAFTALLTAALFIGFFAFGDVVLLIAVIFL